MKLSHSNFHDKHNLMPCTNQHFLPFFFSLSILSFHHSFFSQFTIFRRRIKAGARAKPPSGAQSHGAAAGPPSETGSRGSSIRRASSQAAKSPTPVTSPSEAGATSKGRPSSVFFLCFSFTEMSRPVVLCLYHRPHRTPCDAPNARDVCHHPFLSLSPSPREFPSRRGEP